MILLGIDSAFANLEAMLTVLQDTIYFKDTPRHFLLLLPCTTGWLFSIIYCTDAGLSFQDVVDFYINFVMIIVGFCEAFGSGWAYGMVHQMKLLGTAPVVAYVGANFLSVLVGCALWFGVKGEHAMWSGFVGLISTYSSGIAVTTFYLSKRLAQDGNYTWESIWWELSFGNIVRLRNRIQPVIGAVPFLWCFLIKQFIPHILIVLFINLATSKNENGDPNFGNYGGYEKQPFQALGILTLVFTLVLVIIGVIFPKIYETLALAQVDDYDANDDAEPAILSHTPIMPSSKQLVHQPHQAYPGYLQQTCGYPQLGYGGYPQQSHGGYPQQQGTMIVGMMQGPQMVPQTTAWDDARASDVTGSCPSVEDMVSET